MFVTSAPPPDAPTWPGRRPLALLDGAAWPALFAWLTAHWLGGPGITQGVMLALCGLAAALRAHRALFRNQRYRFTTWRWGRGLVVLLWIGVCLQLVAGFAR